MNDSRGTIRKAIVFDYALVPRLVEILGEYMDIFLLFVDLDGEGNNSSESAIGIRLNPHVFATPHRFLRVS
jgi:hypothetical protein